MKNELIDWEHPVLQKMLAETKTDTNAWHDAMLARAEEFSRQHHEQHRLTALWTRFDLWFSTRVLAGLGRGWDSLFGRLKT